MSDRTIPPLETARRVRQWIGPDDPDGPLEQIRAALRNDPADRAFRILLIQGDGGWGKSRLLEAARDAARPADGQDEAAPRWDLNGTLVADIVDLSDLQLHDRGRFIDALYEALKTDAPTFSFQRFDSARDDLWVRRGYGLQFQTIDEREQQIGQAFLEDLAALTGKGRVAFLIDTVEQLDKVTPHWIRLQEKSLGRLLLRSEDVKDRTFYWLTTEFIRYAELSNVTLILAGREKEAEVFFEEVRAAVDEARRAPDRAITLLEPLTITRLDYGQTVTLFEQLAEDWANTKASEKPYAAQIAASYRQIAADEDFCRLLWFLAAGKPARLMLYAQVVIELGEIPTPLKLTLAEAVAWAADEAAPAEPAAVEEENAATAQLIAAAEALLGQPTERLRQLQWEVEDSLVNMLLRALGDTRARVLLALARTQRALTREQLHYALDCRGDPPDRFLPNPRRLQELEEVMEQISNFYLGKRQPRHLPDSNGQQPLLRVALQEDFHDIFVEHLASAEGGPPGGRLLAQDFELWGGSTKDSVATSTKAWAKAFASRRKGEQQQRRQLYRRLADWADHQVRQERDQKRLILHKDEETLERRIDLTDPKSFQFLDLTPDELRRRLDVDEAIAAAEIERMVFLLLLDPDRNLNSEYLNLDDDRPRGSEQGFDFWAQAEMRRILFDDKLMVFADFRPRVRARRRGETPLQVLRRFADQEDVVRWIKRFTLRGDLRRAVQFGTEIEDVIRTLPQETEADSHAHYSWNHSVARAERALWTNYARILSSDNTANTADAVQEIENAVRSLHELHVRPTTSKIRGEGLHAEYGFAATKRIPEHPAAIRVRRLLSQAYSCLGYGYRMQGHLKMAVKSYGQALTFVRDDVGQMMAHRAAVLNQLSHALSDLGWDSSPVCLDGLRIRRELAEEVSLAQSYNTLAFIFDDMGRYEDAPLLSARAMAYSRRAGSRRQLAFSLRQMAESLRHMAMRQQASQRAGATPDRLYAAAYTLLLEAELLFERPDDEEADVGRGIEEPSRLVEVLLERGSLYRDMLAPDPEGRLPVNVQGYYRDALFHLNKAAKLAERQSEHFGWDIHINRARVHYYYGDLDKARTELDKVVTLEKAMEYLHVQPNGPDMYRYLSTAQMIRGWIAMSGFRKRVDDLKGQDKGASTASLSWDEGAEKARRAHHEAVAQDDQARACMDQVVEAYALGLEFARRFSPRSRSVALLEGDLYDRLRAANKAELEMFSKSLKALRRKQAKLSSLENLTVLLHDFLGFPDTAPAHRQPL